jgi:hypothetical protein
MIIAETDEDKAKLNRISMKAGAWDALFFNMAPPEEMIGADVRQQLEWVSAHLKPGPYVDDDGKRH